MHQIRLLPGLYRGPHWGSLQCSPDLLARLRKGKEGKESALVYSTSTTKRSDVDHTELPANTPHLPFLRISIR